MSSTMTLDEIRDELARLAGWEYRDVYMAHRWVKDGRCYIKHPIPATLEEAAKLPEGWRWDVSSDPLPTVRGWTAFAPGRATGASLVRALTDDNYVSHVKVPYTGSELYDRFALRLACERAESALKETPR